MAEFPSVIAQACAAIQDGRFERAAELANRVLERSPSCLAALRALAWAQLELANESALITFQRCSAIDPEDALAHVGQAIWYEQRDMTETAIQSWTRAWELEPQNQDIRRALVRLTGDLPDSALADGIALARAGRHDEAADALRRLSAGSKPDPAAALPLLTTLWMLGARRAAGELAGLVLSHNPQCVKALLFVAALDDAAGRTLRSRDLLARAEQADPGFVLFAETVHLLGLLSTKVAHAMPLRSAS
jgi:tetratricopeptide (TPR) repeat protein